MPPALTIAIPTFERPAVLRTTVARLLPQLTSEVELVILDNASPTPASEALSSLLNAPGGEKVRIIRHRVNIGGNANICRCFEVGLSPWIWILGDDDEPEPDAVATILRGVHEHPEAVLLHYGVRNHPCFDPAVAPLETRGAADFLRRGRSLGALNFMSASIYHNDAVLPHLKYGLQYLGSCLPHLIVALLAMAKDGQAVTLVAPIATWTPPPQEASWSPAIYALGIGTVLDLPFDLDVWEALRSRIAERKSWRTGGLVTIRALCARYGRDPDNTRILWTLDQAYVRYERIRMSRRERVVFHGLRLVLRCPFLGRWAARRLARGRIIAALTAGGESRV